MGQITVPRVLSSNCLGILARQLETIPMTTTHQATQKVSAPGEYSGYSPVLYDGHVLSSQYVTVRDGTRLAIDIIRPANGGVPSDVPHPVVWMHMTYNRRYFEGGLTAQTYAGAALALVKYGYVVAAADMRGCYGSFGRAVTPRRAAWQPEAFYDAYDITEWLAIQPWSDGNIGMWGCSATGASQWQAAASAPPSLKAIMPLSAPSEYYDINGVTATEPVTPPPWPADAPPASDSGAAPVDEDTDGAMLAAAADEHRWNIEPGIMPFRDSPSPWLAELEGREDVQVHQIVNTFERFPEIAASGIPFYQSANWGEDYRVKSGVVIKAANLSNPKKTMFVPGPHCIFSNDYRVEESNPFSITTEALRWFDHWLKGVQNGIMDEPSVLYFMQNARTEEDAWRSAETWPVPGTGEMTLYLGSSGAGGLPLSGVNRGTLTPEAPTESEAADDYTVDYSATPENRAERGMSYTSAPLSRDTEIVGSPIVRLWIRSTATDGDFLAFLYDVDETGVATRVPGTDEGQLRASLRRLNDPAFDTAGLPYHRCFAEDHEPLVPGEPAELVFDLAPLAYNFHAGHRIRLVFSCVAIPRPGAPQITPILNPPPVVGFFRDTARASSITFPICKAHGLAGG